MILYYLIYKRDLRLPIRETELSKKTILDQVITMIHKIPLFKKSVKTTINRV